MELRFGNWENRRARPRSMATPSWQLPCQSQMPVRKLELLRTKLGNRGNRRVLIRVPARQNINPSNTENHLAVARPLEGLFPALSCPPRHRQMARNGGGRNSVPAYHWQRNRLVGARPRMPSRGTPSGFAHRLRASPPDFGNLRTNRKTARAGCASSQGDVRSRTIAQRIACQGAHCQRPSVLNALA